MKTNDISGFEKFAAGVELGDFIRDVHGVEGAIDVLIAGLSDKYDITIKGLELKPVWEMNKKAPVAYFPKLEFEI